MYSDRIRNTRTIFQKVRESCSHFGLAFEHDVSQCIRIMIKESRDAMLRVRCEKQLKRRLITISLSQGIDLSDTVRIALHQYAGQFAPQPLQQFKRNTYAI